MMARHIRGGDYDQGYRAGSAVGMLLASSIAVVSTLVGYVVGRLM